jgi:RNA polymerase sigma-70 factor (ECF subfamily)
MKRDAKLDDRSQDVLAAARAGQEWAWAAIYRDLAPSLLGYLRARGAAEPEDLLGELFLQMVRDIERFTGGAGDLRAWAFAIARNRLVDDRRYRARRPVEIVAPHALASGAAPDPGETWPPSIAGKAITAALRRLPAVQRDVVLLRVLGELTVDEVASVVGKTPGAVKAIHHRAIATLRREISQSTVTL